MSERSPDLWFADGTLIVRAKDVLFRVYGGMLASKSSVFADMLQVAGAAGSDDFEGCPVVELYDAPDELLHFLKTIHDAQYYAERYNQFRVVLSVLRLATKYDAPYFSNHALGVFSAQFPTTWDEWHRSYATDPSMDLTRVRMAVQLVHLTAELPLQRMLPSALLLLSTGAPLIDIIQGTPFDDGSRIELPWLVKRQCLLGRGELFSAYRAQLYPLLERFASGQIASRCTLQRGVCKGNALSYIKALNAGTAVGAVNILKPGRLAWRWAGHRTVFCDSCRDVLEPLYHQQCAAIWEKLPTYFDLPSWEELA